ncbi:hypothetical protein NL676_028242 [Syzygium grande]|nr:hypothetical protein NL676_028242 [Syzygium grande]
MSPSSQSDTNNNVGVGPPISQAPPVGDGSIAKRASSASNNSSKWVAVPHTTNIDAGKLESEELLVPKRTSKKPMTLQPSYFRGTNKITNFDISLYDMKRICSSSTLIASDLAKRSPKEATPAHLDPDYNSFATSLSLQELLAMTNGETSEDFTNMVWSSNMPKRQDPPTNANTTNGDALIMGLSNHQESLSVVARHKCS